MESAKRKSCLLRLRQNCPFRKLCRHKTYDVSAANSSPIGSYWNNMGPPTSNQPISTIYSEPLPHPSRCQCVCSPIQSEAAADVHMEEENHQNHQNQQNHQDHQNHQDQQDHQNHQDHQDHQNQQDHQDHQNHQNQQDHQDHQNHQDQQDRAEDWMDLDFDFDPETGESTGMTPPTCQSEQPRPLGLLL